MKKTSITISEAEGHMRLDRVLAIRFPDHSRSRLQRLIRDGFVAIEGHPSAVRAGRLMASGEVVTVDFPPPVPSELVPEPVPLSILLEDEDLLLIDKPAGVVVHPGAGNRTGTLVHALLHHCGGLSTIGGVERPGIVHRLDKQTSGVLLVAKNDAAHRAITRQFQERSVSKTYLALVWGRPSPPSGTIDVPIGRDTVHRTKISARSNHARQALTRFRTLERLDGFTWIEVIPRTGRTHQIRVHMSLRSHPVVGDGVYGAGRWKQVADPARRKALAGFRRLALHAHRLEFDHPRSGRRIVVEAPVPAELIRLLEVLRG